MVRPGYKQSEVGIIPEDWGVSTLRAAFPKLEAGVSVNSDNMTSSKYHILKTSAVHNGIVDPAEVKPVIKADYSRLKCPLVQGSIIISRMNTPALVGECGYVKNASIDVYLPDRLWQVQNPKDSDYNFEWLNYLLNTKRYRDAVRATATGTSNSMKNISKERLMEIDIPCPSLDEQNRISAALSDIDTLIANLEKLIAKKKAIKQGAMQELLTGKRKLPGFTEEWKINKIGAFGEFVSGSCFPLAYQGKQGERYPFYKVSDFNNPGNERNLNQANNYISPDTADYLGCKIIPEKAIVIAKIGAAIFLERKKLTTVCCCIDNNMMAFVPFDVRSAQFICYVFQSMKLGELAEATALPSLSGKTICSVERKFPQTIEEQMSIATVLADMDSEIDVLSEKLSKYRMIKSGMMSELLTGRIRLIDKEDA